MVASKHFRKIAVAVIALGCVGSANAWITVMYGNYTTVGGFTTNNYNVLYSDLMPNETAAYAWGFGPGTFGGDFTLTNGAATLNAEFTATSVLSGGTYSFSGIWTELSNVLLPDVVPTGTISGSFDHFDVATNSFGNGDWGWNIVGQAVPEPTAYAVLGIGLAGLLIRRKKTR